MYLKKIATKEGEMTTIGAMTTDGKVMEIGEEYSFNFSGKLIYGTFKGFSKEKNALIFDAILNGVKIDLNIMPECIEIIFIGEIIAEEIPVYKVQKNAAEEDVL